MEEPKLKKFKQEPTKQLILVIEDCSLEVSKVAGEYVILCSDKHANFLRKNNKDPSSYRPDILHQCLLMLLDSPLNRAGYLKVYFRTRKNVLVQVNPQCRIPRTFDRFCGLMVQLLHELRIRASEGSDVLLKVVKNPITLHLPIGCKKYLTTFNCQNLTLMKDIVNKESNDPIVIVVGGISHGKIVTDYTEKEIKMSNFPLSAALACAKLTNSFEEIWNIL